MHRGYELPGRSLVSQADQSLVERPDVPRSRFRQSWSHKKTFDAGLLYPFCVIEVVPGDHIRLRAQPFVRTATPLFPIMDSQRVDTHFFYVPSRILWQNFKKMFGEQDNPADSIAFTVPQVTSTGNGFAVGSVGDHFGLPCVGQAAAVLSVNALPFRAYNRIWNDWFRDENLQNSATVSVGSGPDVESAYILRPRNKSHDYFTSCLPAPQKFTAPTVNNPVRGLGLVVPTSVVLGATNVVDAAIGVTSYTNAITDTTGVAFQTDAAGNPQVFAQASVSLFREAFLIQQYLEKDSRGGTRYIERNKIHFGVTSPDARLQRPEYIGGGATPLQFTPIAQTATGGTGLGSLGAAGTAAGQHSASYAATEDGYIIGLISVKSELSYSQGIHRMWSRLSKFDFYVPTLAGLTEQAVLRKEIYATGVPANDDVVFGYQERFQELRTRYSEVTGLFRPTSAGNIDEWHLSQQFSVAPTLGDTFIRDTPPMSRVLAAGAAAAGMQYLADIVIEMDAVRPVPVYGTPAQLGRF